jgi:hypothetical protein
VHNVVRVADAPVLLRVAQEGGGDVVKALAFADDVFLQKREAVSRRQEPAAQIDDASALRLLRRRRPDVGLGVQAGVAAVGREEAASQPSRQ